MFLSWSVFLAFLVFFEFVSTILALFDPLHVARLLRLVMKVE